MATTVDKRRLVDAVVSVADAASWYLALGLVALVLLSCLHEGPGEMTAEGSTVRGRRFAGTKSCEEIYVVSEGETLHSISDKCGDPFIVERNPHVHDPDDVFPGLVLMIIAAAPTKPCLGLGS